MGVGLALLVGCGGDGPSSPAAVREKPFTVITGANLTDTVQAKPTTALTVQVRDSLGVAHKGMIVRFEALPPLDSARKTETAISVAPLTGSTYATLSVDQADSLGRAKALIAFGTVAGTVRLRVVVPELGIADTLGFTVKPGTPTKIIVGVRDTTVQPGASYQLRARATDRFGNATGTALTYAAASGVSVANDGVVTAGPAIARGIVVVTSGAGTDTGRVSVVPRLSLIGTRFASYAGTSGMAVTRIYTDGSNAVNLATSQSFSLSPNQVASSELVVYYQGDPNYTGSISIIDPKSGPRQLVSTANGFRTAAWPRLSADAQWVYFIGARGATSGLTLWRIRADGTQPDSLTVYGSSPLAAPSVSPSGQFVAVADYSSWRLFDLNTRTSKVFTQSCGNPRFSPDGTRISCMVSGAVSIVNLDGSLNKSIPVLGAVSDVNPADWTPDGSGLLVVPYTGGAWTMVNATTGASVPLPNLTGFYQLQSIR